MSKTKANVVLTILVILIAVGMIACTSNRSCYRVQRLEDNTVTLIRLTSGYIPGDTIQIEARTDSSRGIILGIIKQ